MKTNMINIKIDGREYSFNEEISILEAAKSVGMYIPSLCFLKDINKNASCRICLVESRGKLLPACSTNIWDGLEIQTNTKQVRETRKTILQLIAADHNFECGTCIRNGNCELKSLCELYNIRDEYFDKNKRTLRKDNSSVSIVRDENKCIKCGRCVAVCKEQQQVGILTYAHRAEEFRITTSFNKMLNEAGCISCGQCAKVCPVGAIYEKESIDEFWEAVDDSHRHVVVQIAPAVRVSIAEEFNLDIDDISPKLVTILKNMGVDRVFDTNFAADLTIMEETNELIQRIKNDGVLPLMTSCSPGWVNYVEKYYPEFIPNLSSCKSPQQMFGAIAKSYYADKVAIEPKDITVVSIMPCTAKKYEANRDEFTNHGVKDVDIVLTTREFVRLIKQSGMNLSFIEDSNYDDPLGNSTGAGAIFGTSGGVMEAALRTAYEKLTNSELKELDFLDVRGDGTFKEASVNINETEVKVAVVNGIQNMGELLEKINQGEKYCFIEVMCCPGGCIGGGGQPYDTSKETLKKRMKSMYKIDKNKGLRKSHMNPSIKELYDKFLGEPGSHKAEKLLHTFYSKK